MQHWSSTFGLAVMAAYWLLVLIFVLLSLILSLLLIGRARACRTSAPLVAVSFCGVAPALLGAGAGIEGHPGWALFLSVLAVALSLWWLRNMAQREP